jgi:hypothetical protein
MKKEKLKNEDYMKIFEKVLDHINKLCEQGSNGNKNGLCRLIRDIIPTLYPGTADFILIKFECLNIIEEATGHVFSSVEYYWYNDRIIAVPEKEWYEPRIKCVEDTIKWLKLKIQ